MIVFVNQFCGQLCKDMSYTFAESFEEVELHTGSMSVPMEDLPLNLIIKKSVEYNRKSSLKRVISWIIFTLQCFLRLTFSSSKNRLWILVSNPPLVPLALGWLANQKGIPFIIVIYDLYPDVLIQTKTVRQDTLIIKIWTKINRQIFKKAATICTLSESMKASVDAYLKAGDLSVQVIHNWADNEQIKPIIKNQNTLITKNKWIGKFIVLYSGNIGSTHDLESLVEAASLLKAEKDLLFVVAGEGSKKKSLIALALKLDLQNIQFLPHQCHESFPSLLAAADIAVIALGTGAEGLSVPSKTYSALASGACILGISPENSELGRLIVKYQAGKNFIPGSVTDIADFIRNGKNEPESLNYFKENALLAARNFTPDNANEYTKTIINTLGHLFTICE